MVTSPPFRRRLVSLIRLILMVHSACLGSAVAGCSKSPESEAAAGASSSVQTPSQAEPVLYGRWRITGINGTAPLQLSQSDETNRPHLTFSRSRYDGSTGCNSF